MQKQIVYTKASNSDAPFISSLHKLGIPTGFLSKQSPSFLEALYAYLIKNEIVYVAKDRQKVVGFIAVSKNTSGLYKRFLKSNILILIKFAIQNLFSLDFIKKAFETLNAPKKTSLDSNYDLPELLSIVVDKNYMKKGIGKELLSLVEKDLKELSFNSYKVLVGLYLEANSFYLRNKFVKIKEIELHKGEKSFIYVKEMA